MLGTYYLLKFKFYGRRTFLSHSRNVLPEREMEIVSFFSHLFTFSIILKFDPSVLIFGTSPGLSLFMSWQSTTPSLRVSSYEREKGFPITSSIQRWTASSWASSLLHKIWRES